MVDGGCHGPRDIHGICRLQRIDRQHDGRLEGNWRRTGATDRQLENAARLLPVRGLLYGKPVALKEAGTRHPDFAGPGTVKRRGGLEKDVEIGGEAAAALAEEETELRIRDIVVD